MHLTRVVFSRCPTRVSENRLYERRTTTTRGCRGPPSGCAGCENNKVRQQNSCRHSLSAQAEPLGVEEESSRGDQRALRIRYLALPRQPLQLVHRLADVTGRLGGAF